MPTRARQLILAFAVVYAAVSLSPSLTPSLIAQSTVGTGSIVGTVSDPTGAVISGAGVTVTNVATGQVIIVTTNSSGSFNSGALIPGNYKTLVSAKGFKPAEAAVTVLVGNTASVSVKLQVGSGQETVDVQDAAAAVNTEQPTVQGVLNERQIENLPVNGAISKIWHSWSQGSRFKMAGTLSGTLRMAFLRYLLAAASVTLLESKWTALMCLMKSSALPQ